MRHILYLTGNDIALYATDKSSVHALGQFRHNPQGLDCLKKHLERLEDNPIAILADLIEEEFREDSQPHTIGRDRKSLHARQAGKLYRSTPFRQSHVVGRAQDGRRDDQVVFSALTNRDNLEPLLSLINESGLPLSGIHSLPICTRKLLKPLGAKNGSNLVVTQQPNGGLRETLIRKGQVRFSRLAPVSENSPQEYCTVLNSEIDKTQRYLHTLRLLPRDETLNVFTLTDAARVEAMENCCSNTDTIHFHPVNLSHLAGLIGYKGYPDTRFGDALLVYLLHKHKCSNHYAQPPHLREFRTWQLRRATHAAMWFVMFGGLALSGMNLVDARLMKEKTAQVRQATEIVNERYHQVTRQLPPEFEDARSLREAISIADRLENSKVNVEELLSLLGKGFSQQPNLTISNFKWRTSDSASTTINSEQQQAYKEDEVTNVPDIRYVISDIKGQLRSFDGSYRKAHDQVDRLVAWLLKQPGVHDVSIIRKPLNTRTDSELQGALDKDNSREIARFEIRLVTEVTHGSV